METNLNSQWASRAATVRADDETKKPRPTLKLETKAEPVRGSALAIAGLTAEDVRKLAAKFTGPSIAADKTKGVPAAKNDPMISVWLEVTPDMARRWLQSNFRNRPISDDVVTAYARDMAAGRWQPTHQGIAFNERYQLIDGQHRLAAVIQFGATVRMMVTFGLASKIAGTEMTTMDCVDRGRARTVADQLKIQHGLKEGTQIAGIAAALAHLCVGERMRRLSVGHTLDVYRAFEPGVNHVIEHRSKQPGLKSAGGMAAFAFVYGIKGADVPARFARLITGKELEKSPALALLHTFLTGQQAGLIIKSMSKGIAELSLWAIWTDMFHPEQTLLAESPAEWLKAVEFFRAQQPARVAKIAALFRLPEGK